MSLYFFLPFYSLFSLKVHNLFQLKAPTDHRTFLRFLLLITLMLTQEKDYHTLGRPNSVKCEMVTVLFKQVKCCNGSPKS